MRFDEWGGTFECTHVPHPTPVGLALLVHDHDLLHVVRCHILVLRRRAVGYVRHVERDLLRCVFGRARIDDLVFEAVLRVTQGAGFEQ